MVAALGTWVSSEHQDSALMPEAVGSLCSAHFPEPREKQLIADVSSVHEAIGKATHCLPKASCF